MIVAAPAVAAPKPRIQINLTADVTNVTTSTGATFTWTSNVPGAAYTCSIDGGAASSCTSPKSYVSLAEGNHTFAVRAKRSGVYRPGSAVYSWLVDTSIPGAPSIEAVPSPTRSKDAVISFTNDDPTAFRHWCSLDDAAAVPCSSPFPVPGPLSDGPHTVTVQSQDASGVMGESSTVAWTVDNVSPFNVQLTGPTSPSSSAVASFTFSAEGADRYTCALDGAAAVPCTSPHVVSGLADGDHALVVNAEDDAGNIQPGLAVWTVDTTAPPAPTFLTGPAERTNQTAADFIVNSTDGASQLQCRLDSSAWAPCPAPVRFTGLTSELHGLDIRAVDAAGNASGVATYAWTVDTSAPGPVQFMAGPGSPSTEPLPTFEWMDTDANTVEYACSLDDGPYVVCDQLTVPLPSAGLGDGAHVLRVKAVNDVGTQSAPAAWTWTVDLPDAPVDPGANPAPSLTPTPTATTPVVATPGGSVTPAAPPATTATVTTSSALLGRATVAFSGDVTGVSAATVRLRTAAGADVPATLSCTNAGGAGVACAGTVRGAALTPVRRLLPGERYAVDVAVTDIQGRPVNATQAFRASTVEQETSLAAAHRWTKAKNSKALGRSYLVASGKTATVSFRFSGPKVTWYTVTGPDQGRAKVFVDGVRKARVNNWSRTTEWRVPRVLKKLGPGSHELRIVVSGRKGARSAAGTNVVLDAVRVGRTLSKAPAVTMAWQRVVSASASARGYAVASEAKAQMSFTFRGTSLTWTTVAGPAMGKAKVFIDGRRMGTVDNYAKRLKYGVRRTFAGLSDKTHTVKIVVTGAKRRAAAGTSVAVDRWSIG